MRPMERIFITGISGTFGHGWVRQKKKEDSVVLGGSYHQNKPSFGGVELWEADLRSKEIVSTIFEVFKPTVVVHAAAATDLEWCEANPWEAWRLNAEITEEVAEAARSWGAQLVYLSTDFVFDGDRGNYREEDCPKPLNVYAATKWEGEQRLRAVDPDALIVRTNFFANGFIRKTFPNMVLDALQSDKPLRLAADQYANALDVDDLIRILKVFLKERTRGIYHVGCTDTVSRWEFAHALAQRYGLPTDALQRTSLKALSESLGWKAKRPHNTSLNVEKTYQTTALPNLRDTLESFRNCSRPRRIDLPAGDTK